MLARIESWIHRLRRRISRSEWAIRHLGLVPSSGASEEPGLLLIQIDGLARGQLERALASGRMPYLRRLRQRNGYDLHTFYPGLPSTTPAVQAELYYGVRSAVPAFSFFDRELKVTGRMWDPEWAKQREAACARQAEGLLQGGSSWSNIYTGGAGLGESHFCAASSGFGDMWRDGKFRNVFVFVLLNLYSVVRIAGLLLLELGAAIADSTRAVLRGRRPRLELWLVLSRAFVGVALRELLTIGGQVDVARGLPIVHLNFVGYDEQAHHRGPGSHMAHLSLGGIDGAIRRLSRAAHRSTRRDYEVWIFSDHGQETTRPIPPGSPGGVETVVRECLEAAWKRDAVWQVRSQPHRDRPWLLRGRAREERRSRERHAARLTEEQQKTFFVTAMGPVGHVYFSEPKTAAQRHALGLRLVRQGGVPGVLVRDDKGGILWLHAKGETQVPVQVPALLPHPTPLAAEIAKDLVDFCANLNSGDLVLLAWSPWGVPSSFAEERGGHGGFGLDETQGFVLLPPRTRLPPGTEAFVRPSALRAAARHHLGRERIASRPGPASRGSQLRLMTYNVHSCVGMDGRVSPRRVARAVAREQPDILALQEIDLGRRRSRAEDQAAIIASELGLHAVFCPTVTVGDEHYGHALLSRWPIEIVRRALLPHDPKTWWPEPRAALWARVQLNERRIHVITTHLGLGPSERLAQMKSLLGPDWIGGIPADEAVILCGDFNCVPGSAPCRIASSRLRDVQAGRKSRRTLGTFTSARPLVRLDHIFVSPHFETVGVSVLRSDLTRVASDHLPLFSDLRVAAEASATSSTKGSGSEASRLQGHPALRE